MKRILLITISAIVSLAAFFILSGCNANTMPSENTPSPTKTETNAPSTDKVTEAPITEGSIVTPDKTEEYYVNITQDEANAIMDSGVPHIILDVRTESEYNQGHIPNAILIPDTEIKEKAESIITDKNSLILVYCRSGNRSKKASEYLLELGYTNIKEFGGIIDWQYDIEY